MWNIIRLYTVLLLQWQIDIIMGVLGLSCGR